MSDNKREPRDPICPTCEKPITDKDAVMHHNCLEPIVTKLWLAKGALGYSVPGHVPCGDFKCGLCEAKYNEIQALRTELEQARAEISVMKLALDWKDDEYVRQVGSWKIIQRLEEQAKDCDLYAATILKLAEALEKYGNPQNWRYWDNRDVGAHDAWLDFKPGHFSKTHNDLGIYIARDALTQAKPVIEKCK